MYTFPNVFSQEPTPTQVLGAVSIIFWTLTLIALVKYVFIVMSLNDDGEGASMSSAFMRCFVLCNTVCLEFCATHALVSCYHTSTSMVMRFHKIATRSLYLIVQWKFFDCNAKSCGTAFSGRSKLVACACAASHHANLAS